MQRPRPILVCTILTSILCCAVISSVALARVEDQSSPAIVIDRGLMLTPPQIAETGIAPEVAVRATINEMGIVASVEVLSIDPSSEHDAVVREAVSELIGGWRFAPARDAQGAPIESTTSVTLSFRDARMSSQSEPTSDDPFEVERFSGTARADEQVFRTEALAEILDRLARTAERAIDPDRRRAVLSPRFVVVTDAEGEGIERTVAGNLEAVFNFLDELFANDIEPLPEREKIRVYFYGERTDFNATYSGLSPLSGVAGFYRSPGLLAFHQETRSDYLMRTFLHEATHAYISRYVKQPMIRLPTWFSEGLAEYIGNSRIDRKGSIQVGRAVAGEYVLNYHSGARRQTTSSGWTLDEVKTAIAKGDAPSIEELLLLPPALFSGPDGSLHYGMAWLFVHFLRHGDADARGSKGRDAEWATTQFPRFMLYVAEGFPAREALEHVYEVNVEDFEDAFNEYARRF